MDLSPAQLEEVARELGLTDSEVAARKTFLDFGPDNVACLKALHGPLERARAGIVNEFYAHLYAQMTELAAGAEGA